MENLVNFFNTSFLKYTLTLLTTTIVMSAFSQTKRNTYIQPEYTFGTVFNSYPDSFPETGYQQGFAVNIGSVNTDTSGWAKYYNYPETGISLLYTNFGNNEVFGHQLGAVPYISYPIFNGLKGNYHLKLGLGLAYFTTYYDPITNPTNQLVSTPFTWDVKIFLHRNIYTSKKFNLILGGGISHESNGHTKMPNMGVNSFLLSLSGQFYTKNNPYLPPSRIKGKNLSPKKGFIYFRQGVGIHEQSDSEGPETGVTKIVSATALAAGYTYNKHLKLRVGLNYKYYDHYYTYLHENDVEGLSQDPILNSSAFVLFVGNELLMSHFSIDTEIGFNLFKPFYKEFHQSENIGVVLMSYLTARIGLNAYLFNTNKLPTHNVSVGAHINTNLGKADYTEFSIGYTYNFN